MRLPAPDTPDTSRPTGPPGWRSSWRSSAGLRTTTRKSVS